MARPLDPALRQWWRELISLQPDSGMSIARFCDAHQVSTTSFYQWRRKINDPDPTRSGGFLCVEVLDGNEPTGEHPFRIHLPGGAIVEIPLHQRDVLHGVIDQLSRVDQPFPEEPVRT